MTSPKRTVLVTGCSDGGLGAALAVAFHKAGLHVYATARNPGKMAELSAQGIETLTLDVLSESSIAACAKQVSSLDILVNNAGGGYSMPFSDSSIPEAKKLFDLNLWSPLAVTQAFLPLLLKSKGMIVNNTSVNGLIPMPFMAAYNASKAALSSYTETQRLELAPFDVTVVDLKTGGVMSNFFENKNASDQPPSILPAGSIYEPAREIVESVLRGDVITEQKREPASQWAKNVVKDLLYKRPPPVVWRGSNAGLIRLSTVLPQGTFDGQLSKMNKLDVVERAVRK
ncbi:hypothetical protein MMC10_000280 [Thelotrema lepadinum]|nr:hypothetical protein [Thelotrema lepadinum]